MEPISTALIAIGTVMANKALEKTAEKISEGLWDKSAKFLVTLKKESPQTVTAIEKVPEQPLDYGKAVLEVESAALANPEVNQAMEELALLTNNNPPSNWDEIMSEIKASLEKSQQESPSTFNQNILKAVNAAQYQKNDQRGSTFNI